MLSSIEYYEENALAYFSATKNIDMSEIYNKFERYLFPKASILDLGCGSGRDSLYFLKQGYNVIAIDGSENMCVLASKYVGIPVRQLKIENMDYNESFDAIWANASLLHIEQIKILSVLRKCIKALKNEGIFYASWKYGEGERWDENRIYCDFSIDSLNIILSKIPNIIVEEIWLSEDQMKRSNTWVNIIIKKVGNEHE